MDSLNPNPNSHLTAKDRDKLSFPARILLERGLLKGSILDFGCGFGADVMALRRLRLPVEGYDKFHNPYYPTGKFDTIVCIYVLNVLLPEEQETVKSEIQALLKPNGKVYYAVRRDLRSEGFRMHKIHKQRTYQCNVVLDLETVYANDFCEIYVGGKV